MSRRATGTTEELSPSPRPRTRRRAASKRRSRNESRRRDGRRRRASDGTDQAVADSTAGFTSATDSVAAGCGSRPARRDFGARLFADAAGVSVSVALFVLGVAARFVNPNHATPLIAA